MNVHTLFQHALNSKPVDFANTFKNVMRERVVSAIEARRQDVAQGIYGNSGVDGNGGR